MPKLNQIIAIESGIKNRAKEVVDGLYKAVQKPDLFNGFTKQYERLREDGEQFPPESKQVQMTHGEVLAKVRGALAELFDVTWKKDSGNRVAKADVRVGDEVLLRDAPATYLLFVEKQLTDLHTFVGKMPTLDPAEEWSSDASSGLKRTPPSLVGRTKKNQKALVLYPATQEHPAQTQLITEDELIGHWRTTKLSGAMPSPERERLLDRIQQVQRAVKFAREEANGVQVESSYDGAVLGWIFS